MTRTSSDDDIGDDVVMRADNADENRANHPSSSGSDSRRRITTKGEPREVRDAQTSVTERDVPRRISVNTTLSEHPVAVTTQEALDGYREKTMRVANVENNTLNWVSISRPGALDMTHCDFSVRSARDEMRHIIGSSEPDVIIGFDKDQNQGCRKKGKDHLEFLCELYEAQAAYGRCFVRELTSEVNSTMKCVTRIMVMRGTRTIVADLWMLGLAACDEEDHDLSMQAYGQSPTWDKLECGSTEHTRARTEHARVCANSTSEKIEQTGTWVHQVARAMEEQLREDKQELKTREQKKNAKDAKMTRGIVHEKRQKRNMSRAR